MSRNRQCGQYPPAAGHNPYCPVCARCGDLVQLDDDEYETAVEAEYAQADRVSRLHQAYRRKKH